METPVANPMPLKKKAKLLLTIWVIAVIAFGITLFLPPYFTLTAKLKFLTSNPLLQPSWSGFSQNRGVSATLHPLSNRKILVDYGNYMLVYNPADQEYYHVSGKKATPDTQKELELTSRNQERQAGSTLPHRTFSVLDMGGGRLVYVGADRLYEFNKDTKVSDIELGFGKYPLVLKLSSSEILIASGQNITNRRGEGEDAEAKLFKYSLSTKKLTPTNKYAPAIFGGYDNVPVVHDLGPYAVIWEKGGNLFWFTKANQNFQRIAIDVQHDKKKLLYQFFPLTRNQLLLAPTDFQVGDDLFFFNTSNRKITKIDLTQSINQIDEEHADKETKDIAKTVKYTVTVLNSRFALLMPQSTFFLTSQSKDLTSRRLLLDLTKKEFVSLGGQQTKFYADATTGLDTRVLDAMKIDNKRVYFAGYNYYHMDYSHGILFLPNILISDITKMFLWLNWLLLLGAGYYVWRIWRRAKQPSTPALQEPPKPVT